MSKTDAQIDNDAKRYAHENSVSYSEALGAVTDVAQADEGRHSDGVQRGFVAGEDADFHAAVVAAQHKLKISYIEAAKAVASMKKAQPENFSEAVQSGRLYSSDIALHTAATAWQYANNVSYMKALTAVTMTQVEDFSEAVERGHLGNSDATLHTAVTAFQQAHSVSYSEALTAVANTQVERFNESVQQGHMAGADAVLHTTATAWQHAHHVSYSEALTAVTSPMAAPLLNFSEAIAATGAKAAIEGQEIEIFKAGSHIDNAGKARVFPVALVAAMAAVYSPGKHEAPLTLGHPEGNLPAYGWVKSLRATSDGRLMMRAADVETEFSEMVQAKRYKKRSASFYPPNAPNNPVPGSWYLRHVGWLGAQPPAVRGLADVKFGQDDDGVTCFDFNDMN